MFDMKGIRSIKISSNAIIITPNQVMENQLSFSDILLIVPQCLITKRKKTKNVEVSHFWLLID